MSIMMRRRHFLGGSATLIGGLSLPLSGFGMSPVAALDSAPLPRQRMAAVFQDMAYAAAEIPADSYQPPRANRATVDYVNQLSEEEFLRRHYFA